MIDREADYDSTSFEPSLLLDTLVPQLFFTSEISLTRSRRRTVEDTIELSHMSAIEQRCHSSQVSIRGVTGTIKLRPRARHTLLLIRTISRMFNEKHTLCQAQTRIAKSFLSS